LGAALLRLQSLKDGLHLVDLRLLAAEDPFAQPHQLGDAGYEPHEVPDLLITADNPRMAFILATVAGIQPDEEDVP
jgi:hypothetical protein